MVGWHKLLMKFPRRPAASLVLSFFFLRRREGVTSEHPWPYTAKKRLVFQGWFANSLLRTEEFPLLISKSPLPSCLLSFDSDVHGKRIKHQISQRAPPRATRIFVSRKLKRSQHADTRRCWLTINMWLADFFKIVKAVKYLTRVSC